MAVRTKPGEAPARGRGGALPGAVLALGILLALLTGIIRIYAGSAALMEREMLRFAPPGRTGLPASEYPGMAVHITDYLTGRKDSFRYTFPGPEGGEVSCFHDYEEAHMADCRALIRLDGIACGLSLAAALGAAALLLRRGKAGRTEARRGARIALAGLGAAAAALALWAAADFDGLFVTFHRIAFRNDLWLLNPRTDLLIRLMPEEMFLHMGLTGLAVFTAGAAAAAALVLLPLKKRRAAEETAPGNGEEA